MDHATLRALTAEHQKHARQLDALDRALALCSFDAPEVLARMDDVDDGLVEHLQWEEAVLFPWLQQVLPDSTGEVERLEREHVDILAAATVLRLTRTTAPRMLREQEEAAVRFAQLLRRHLEHEEALVERAREAGVVEAGG